MSTTIDRRAILAGAASLPAISIPAIAGEPDPIFDAIEACRKAWRDTEDATSDEESGAAGDRHATAVRQMVDIVPTTLAGLAALVNHVLEYDDPGCVLELVYD
jgi:hypothetical protein